MQSESFAIFNKNDEFKQSQTKLINLQKMGTIRRCHPLYDDEGNLIGNLLFREERKLSDPSVSQQSQVETSHSNNRTESIAPELRSKYDQQMQNSLKNTIKNALEGDMSDEISLISQEKTSSLKLQAEQNPYYPYLNQFHKESTQECMKELEEQENLQLNSKDEAKKHFEMHKRLAKLYPEENK